MLIFHFYYTVSFFILSSHIYTTGSELSTSEHQLYFPSESCLSILHLYCTIYISLSLFKQFAICVTCLNSKSKSQTKLTSNKCHTFFLSFSFFVFSCFSFLLLLFFVTSHFLLAKWNCLSPLHCVFFPTVWAQCL